MAPLAHSIPGEVFTLSTAGRPAAIFIDAGRDDPRFPLGAAQMVTDNDDAVIIQHDVDEGPGLLADALTGCGFRLVRRFREVKPTDRNAALVVVLGGPMAAYDLPSAPFLADELDVLAYRLDYGRPSLGICLGAQLLARAAGTEVRRGLHGPEIGARPIVLSSQGLLDPVFQYLPPLLTVAQWHEDVFDSVPGAIHLASSQLYPQQAFRVGRSYGFQFHPELDASTLLQWVHRMPLDFARAGISARALQRQLAALTQGEPDLARLRRNIATMCADLVSSPRDFNQISPAP